MTKTACRFQFHKGTIKTCIVLRGLTHQSNFNSIKVQLRQKAAEKRQRMEEHFNSIKVQLRLFLLPPTIVVFSNFNSIKVQLRL